jgi:predicted RNA-binding protein with PUA-like domain
MFAVADVAAAPRSAIVARMANHWLMKTEPESFNIADLERVRVEPWSGVRSHFARAYMRQMHVGDEVLFYHSSCEPPGVAGLARVVRTGVVDETQFDPDSKYYDPKATREKPVWDCVDVEYVATVSYFVALPRMRAEPALADMVLLRRGMRLSVQPVTADHYARIVEMSRHPPPPEPPPAPTPRAKAKPRAKPKAKAKTRAKANTKAKKPKKKR